MTAPEGPDNSVRIAWAADAERIGAVQSAAVRGPYAPLLPTVLVEQSAPGVLADAWRSALVRAPSGRHRVLVALGDGTVVGFAALAPSEDGDADPVVDGELLVLHVHPDQVGRGHGSRLLTAAADTLRTDGFRTARTWLLARDDALRAFLESTGWSPDGASRTLDAETDLAEVSLRQVRLHTALV